MNNSTKSMKYGHLSSNDFRSLLQWSSVQGHILTGDGLLVNLTTEGVDFQPSDLPHHLLLNQITRKVFSEWLSENRRSYAIVGCWYRPIFYGGWMESSSADTVAMNLQTPSLFIDMRFPLLRPSKELSKRESLLQCSDLELRILARQHCFAGYTFPEDFNNSGPPLFTRHHIIDWNFHPRFPRNRPNRWWVDLSSDEQSFKEFSFARDSNNVPVYFERWARYAGDGQGKKYLACRRKTECPRKLAAQGRSPQRDGVFIVVGNHFAIAIDRCQPVPGFSECRGAGGGPAVLVDASVSSLDVVSSSEERREAEQLLDLVGNYGHVYDSDDHGHDSPSWTIRKSTHPWREETNLFQGMQAVQLKWTSPSLLSSSNSSGSGTGSGSGREKNNDLLFAIQSITWDGFEWEVVECSFTKHEISNMFSKYSIIQSRL